MASPLEALYQFGLYGQRQGFISKSGWDGMPVSFRVDLNPDGTVEGITDIRVPSETKKKKSGKGAEKKPNLVPQRMTMPVTGGRGSNTVPGFMADSANYILGLHSDPAKQWRCPGRFAAMKEQTLRLLADVHTPMAEAMKGYFQKWDLEHAAEFLFVKENYQLVTKANLIFALDGVLCSEDPEIVAAWDRDWAAKTTAEDSKDLFDGLCRITGKWGKCYRTMPNLVGLPGGMATSSFVSHNEPAFCSYGRKQGANAPISVEAANLISLAFNYMVKNEPTGKHRHYFGDMIVLCWTLDHNKYLELVNKALFDNGGSDEPDDLFAEDNDQNLYDAVKELANGRKVEVDGIELSPDKPFYMLGLSPNSIRNSIRFFEVNTFGSILRNVSRHFERLEYRNIDGTLPKPPRPYNLLACTKRPSSSGKVDISGHEMAELMTAIWNDRPYPRSMEADLRRRLLSTSKLTITQVSLLKAIMLKNHNDPKTKEVAVDMLTNCPDLAYRLGQYLSLANRIQRISLGKKPSTSLTDRFYSFLSEHPKRAFKELDRALLPHLQKLQKQKPGLYAKLLAEIHDVLDTADWQGTRAEFNAAAEASLPDRFNADEYLRFTMGFRHMEDKNLREAIEAKKNRQKGSDKEEDIALASMLDEADD